MEDDPFEGGSPLVGALSTRRRPHQHDHVGEMVYPLDADRVCRHCWCTGCGQEWVVVEVVNARGEKECKGWRPVLD